MYTQCPECSTAFRVTAEVLKQASGKVRCGGCGHPFNALEYLSEAMPEQDVAKEPNAPLPELKPEPQKTNGGAPRSISAEQSAALLKTLDQLAGSDIRIEDTGVEWRVLDEDDAPDPVIDEVLDESPTPVDQFLTKTPTNVEAGEIFEESANALAQTPVEELRFDDNTPLPDDFDLDDESSYTPETTDEDDSSPEDAAAPADVTGDSRVDLMLGEPDEWADILGEVDEPVEPAAAETADPEFFEPAAAETADPEPPAASPAVEPTPAEAGQEILDVDTQFALQAEAMGIDLTGMHAAPDFQPDEAAADNAEGLDEESEEEPGEELEEEPEEELKEELEEELEIEVVDASDEAPLEFGSVDTAIAKLEEQSDVFDKNFFEGEEQRELDEAELELEDDAAPGTEVDEEAPVEEEIDLAESEDGAPAVPPQTEEEQTLNMMIDQDLLNFAVEDEDGFASTIVIPEKDAEDKAIAEKETTFDDEDISTGFETIVMEGESIRSAVNSEKHEADIAAAAALAEKARAESEKESAAPSGGRRRGMIAAAIVLGLVLVAQIMHQSREALATIPAFNNVVGIVYRAAGMPLSPAWDVTGWRFEATQEVIDENDDQLTIYSRIGNKSGSSLPYPLINVALIDRFEETVGNRTLDPAEYLADDLDPSKPVQPGNTFNAVISIQSPAPDATGYKLKVCYRQSAGQLRCSRPSFK